MCYLAQTVQLYCGRISNYQSIFTTAVNKIRLFTFKTTDDTLRTIVTQGCWEHVMMQIVTVRWLIFPQRHSDINHLSRDCHERRGLRRLIIGAVRSTLLIHLHDVTRKPYCVDKLGRYILQEIIWAYKLSSN